MISHEPASIISPDHQANRLSRFFGGFVGRIVLATAGQHGQDFAGAISATAEAFPYGVRTLHVYGFTPYEDEVGYDSEARIHTAELINGLRNLRRLDGYAEVVDFGTSDSTIFDLTDSLRGEFARIWAKTGPADDEHGIVVVTNHNLLPEPHSQQPSPAALVLRLSGVSVDEGQFGWQWQQLHPLAA